MMAGGEGLSGHTSPLAGEAWSVLWLAEPGHRRHNGSASPLRWAGVIRSALYSLLHMTAGALRADPSTALPVQVLLVALRPVFSAVTMATDAFNFSPMPFGPHEPVSRNNHG